MGFGRRKGKRDGRRDSLLLILLLENQRPNKKKTGLVRNTG
jgi:hypothetical protein